MTATKTYALLEVSDAVLREVAGALRRAGQEERIDGDRVHVDGLVLVAAPRRHYADVENDWTSARAEPIVLDLVDHPPEPGLALRDAFARNPRPVSVSRDVERGGVALVAAVVEWARAAAPHARAVIRDGMPEAELDDYAFEAFLEGSVGGSQALAQLLGSALRAELRGGS